MQMPVAATLGQTLSGSVATANYAAAITPATTNSGQQGTPPTDTAAGPAYTLDLSPAALSQRSPADLRDLKRTGRITCETCAARTYQDGSDDPGVSFKAPGHIAPGSSAAVVAAHEQEHVAHEQANARSEDRKVVAQSVQLYSSVCPECGRTYVAGGRTFTQTATDNTAKQSEKTEKGQYVDVAA